MGREVPVLRHHCPKHEGRQQSIKIPTSHPGTENSSSSEGHSVKCPAGRELESAPDPTPPEAMTGAKHTMLHAGMAGRQAALGRAGEGV